MKTNLKLLFYLKKSEEKQDGTCPIMGRVTIGKSMAQFSAKLTVSVSLWDTRANRVSGKSKQAVEINQALDKISISINKHFREILTLKGDVLAIDVKNAFQGIASTQETLLSLFVDHNEEYRKRIGVNRTHRTWENYSISYDHLARFIRHKYNVSDMPVKQLDFSFIENYDFYLRVDCKQMPNTILRQIIPLRKMIKIAINKGIISRDPFLGYVAERPATKQKYLPKAEFEKLMSTTFDHPNRNFTRDMFVFSSMTGLAYADMYNLTHKQIVKVDDGSLWIKIKRQKTGSVSNIPLLDIAIAIIEKYRGIAKENKVFPMLSCGRINIHLKKMAKFCGIERRLIFHMARHTFASETCLSQGVPMETVSQMMGHQSVRTTQIYAKITNDKISEDMKALSVRVQDKYELVSVNPNT